MNDFNGTSLCRRLGDLTTLRSLFVCKEEDDVLFEIIAEEEEAALADFDDGAMILRVF